MRDHAPREPLGGKSQHPVMWCCGPQSYRIPLSPHEVDILDRILAESSIHRGKKSDGGGYISNTPFQFYYISFGKDIFDTIGFDQNIRLLNDRGFDKTSRMKLERLASAVILRRANASSSEEGQPTTKVRSRANQ